MTRNANPEVVDRTDYAEQLDALIEAARDADVHPSDIAAELHERGDRVAGSMWGSDE